MRDFIECEHKFELLYEIMTGLIFWDLYIKMNRLFLDESLQLNRITLSLLFINVNNMLLNANTDLIILDFMVQNDR